MPNRYSLERKRVITAVDGTTVVKAGAIIDVSAIGQGNTRNQRSGQDVWLEDSELRLNMFSNSASGVLFNALRVIIFRWTETTVPTVADILSIETGLESQSALSIISHAFHVLLDKVYNINNLLLSNGSTGAVEEKQQIAAPRHLTRNINQQCQFEGTSTTLGKGKVFILLISNATTNGPIVDLVHTLNFTDI